MNTLTPLDLAHLSRRDFLQRSGAGLLGLFALPFLGPAARLERLQLSEQPTGLAPASIKLGRAVDNSVPVYDQPSLEGKLLRMYYRDVIFDIDEVSVGDAKPEYNRVWYHVRGEGYVHSGKVQPVQLNLSEPAEAIPPGGQLGEVCVPFTDVFRDLKKQERVKYRIYYATTHWVRGVEKDDQGSIWYTIWDDKFKEIYYAHAEHIHLLTSADTAAISPQIDPGEKRIEVWRDSQLVIAYERDTAVLVTKAATGGHFIDGDYTTPAGLYVTARKRPSRHMASEDLAAPNSYDLPGVPWVCYITQSGISFHGTFWHNDFGKQRSHGCINLSPGAAQWIYRWTQPAVPFAEEIFADKTGTRVDII